MYIVHLNDNAKAYDPSATSDYTCYITISVMVVFKFPTEW